MTCNVQTAIKLFKENKATCFTCNKKNNYYLIGLESVCNNDIFVGGDDLWALTIAIDKNGKQNILCHSCVCCGRYKDFEQVFKFELLGSPYDPDDLVRYTKLK